MFQYYSVSRYQARRPGTSKSCAALGWHTVLKKFKVEKSNIEEDWH